MASAQQLLELARDTLVPFEVGLRQWASITPPMRLHPTTLP